jgi:PRTRC genetic system protein A
MLNSRDTALHALMPVLAMPSFETLGKSDKYGMRTLVAANGIFQEICLPWLYAIRRIGDLRTGIQLPYGNVNEILELKYVKSAVTQLLQEFTILAKKYSPVECAAWIVINDVDLSVRLVLLQAISQGIGHIKYKHAVLDTNEHRLFDLHSHGNLPAFFSEEDDKDDRYGIKLAGVIGNCDSAKVSICTRLCIEGKFTSLPPANLFENLNEVA